MIETKELSLGKLVALKPAAAAILEKYHLDFCCKGKQTLNEALANQPELQEKVNSELDALFAQTTGEVINFEEYSLTALADYIVEKHHKYVKEILPVLYLHSQKIASKHGERHPELIKIAEIFAEIKSDFEQHLMKEEEILFPRIRMIDEMKSGNQGNYSAIQIDGPVQMMMMEHENAGEATAKIRILTDDYTPPTDACATYMVAFEELKQFELDLHQHVHLENNILFPKAMSMMENI